MHQIHKSSLYRLHLLDAQKTCSSLSAEWDDKELFVYCRVMRCLMRHLSSPEMTDACEAALLEIQYFISRDWKLDPQLHTACVSDATRLCHAKKDWADTTQNTNNPQRGVQVLPCLFRHAYHPKDTLRVRTIVSAVGLWDCMILIKWNVKFTFSWWMYSSSQYYC